MGKTILYLVIICLFSCTSKNSNIVNTKIEKDSSIILNAQNPDSTYCLDFNIKAKKGLNGGYVLENKKLRAEFWIRG